ncbi:hypothetical protein [Arcobacter sp.]|uniref:hypothetical protein n=1 Tax=Arcobacter sp. TaxID=1872629 RepID=UPI003D0D33EF
MINTYKSLISKYIYAKDNNKPYLMKDVFKDSGKLDIVLNSQNISFPSRSDGLEKIIKVLIKDFNKNFENIFTLCFEDTIVIEKNTLGCNWFVFMSDKDTEEIRLGYGTYLWKFDTLVEELNITIKSMDILSKKDTKIFPWIENVPYPWCNSNIFLNSMNNLEVLYQIKNELSTYLKNRI